MLVCNRPRLTKQALESLSGTPGINITISVDAKSDLETLSIVDVFQSVHRCSSYLSAGDQGTGSLRNRVIEVSTHRFGRGDYLYLSDNDVKFLSPGWLETIIECYEVAWHHGFKVVGAYNHPYHQHNDRLMVNDKYSVCDVHALALQSMLMRWEVWDMYGPFCDTPVGRVCMGEDVDFALRIKKDGGRMGVVDPPLLVNTGITNSFGGTIPGWDLVKSQCPEGVLCE